MGTVSVTKLKKSHTFMADGKVYERILTRNGISKELTWRKEDGDRDGQLSEFLVR